MDTDTGQCTLISTYLCKAFNPLCVFITSINACFKRSAIYINIGKGDSEFGTIVSVETIRY